VSNTLAASLPRRIPRGYAQPRNTERTMDDYTWVYDVAAVDLEELSRLYRIAPLGDKPPQTLAIVFGNSMFTCFVYANGVLVGAGRVLADGLDCAYIADVAVHPDHQGHGLGTAIIRQLVTRSQGHQKIILLRQPGHRTVLRPARLPAHEHGDGDLARPRPCH
jgi:ribosomal protein S18 acetylase RimI-like enzyme